MGLFSRRPSYDRARLLDEASRARARNRRRRAIALYRRVLAVEPANPDLHARIAPLLAQTRQRFDAWTSFRVAARALGREGQLEKAIATYREATRLLPRQLEAWLAIAELERKRGRRREAMEVLLEGRRHFRGGRYRPQAIFLLRRVRAIDPWDPETVLDLARSLARSRQREEAALLLQGLAQRVQGPELRRVRATQWRLEPSLLNSWRLLRAILSSGRAAGMELPA